MNGAQFVEALKKTKRGERLAYHVGNLGRDRLYNVDVDSVAKAATEAAADKRCKLFQRRVDGVTCQYLAERT